MGGKGEEYTVMIACHYDLLRRALVHYGGG